MSLVKVFSLSRSTPLARTCLVTAMPSRSKGDYINVNPPRTEPPSWGELTEKAAHSLFISGKFVVFVS